MKQNIEEAKEGFSFIITTLLTNVLKITVLI